MLWCPHRARTRLCSGLSCDVQAGSVNAERLARLRLVPDLRNSCTASRFLGDPPGLALHVVVLWALGSKASGAQVGVGMMRGQGHLSVARADCVAWGGGRGVSSAAPTVPEPLSRPHLPAWGGGAPRQVTHGAFLEQSLLRGEGTAGSGWADPHPAGTS